jgi:hypothetical protein
MTTYNLDCGTATALDLAWWLAYGLKRIAIAEGALRHAEITQEEFDNVVASHTNQAEQFKAAGYTE